MDELLQAAVFGGIGGAVLSESGKRLVNDGLALANKALNVATDECTTISIARETLRERAAKLLRYIFNRIDDINQLPHATIMDESPFKEPDNLLSYADAFRASARCDTDDKIEILGDLVLDKFRTKSRNSQSMSISNAIIAASTLSSPSLKACAATYLFSYSDSVPGIKLGARSNEDEPVNLMAKHWAPIYGVFFERSDTILLDEDFQPLISSRCAFPDVNAWSNRSIPTLMYQAVGGQGTHAQLRFVWEAATANHLTDIGWVLGRTSFERLTGYRIKHEQGLVVNNDKRIPHQLIKFSDKL
jgi:hypothetical protein